MPLAAGGESKDPPPKPKDEKKGKQEEVLTFTTADLERKYGKSVKPKPAVDPAGEPAAAKPDPLAQLQAGQQAKRDKAAQRVEAQKKVQAAREKVAAIEKRLARLRNPLLGPARPDDDEKEAWKGKDQAGRLRMTEEKLAAARDELAAAETALNELR